MTGIPHLSVYWQLDPRGTRNPAFRCKHASFILNTEVPGESEFLFVPYSTFKASGMSRLGCVSPRVCVQVKSVSGTRVMSSMT